MPPPLIMLRETLIVKWGFFIKCIFIGLNLEIVISVDKHQIAEEN